ncbi:hypothetical protein [Streptomyces sp. 2314.4]|uniref:hypothetical protein n=1 Tax=Streptomyces sp. 2314.4 TaxID=1881025 RepID=UPI0008962671|nr:hypothetical protein [Streptomyces sp. 2314.4]SEE83925.1 hypothetical protein SAMN05428943_6340 [Streptomyces sp. 2314.4]
MSAVDLARRATADPLLRLLAHGFATTYRRPPGAVWRAPYAFRLAASAVEPAVPLTETGPRTDWVAAANWYVAAAVSPRADGLLRCGSLNHPAESAELPLTGPAARAPGWAARPYAVLRVLAAAGFGRGGADLHVNATLPDAVGLPVAEPLECAVALALADVHAARGPARCPARSWPNSSAPPYPATTGCAARCSSAGPVSSWRPTAAPAGRCPPRTAAPLPVCCS